jgi:prolyl-tRNA editing enzyme YbaK/EbsC (Cys-tRNA(Pro) deacylase)
MAHPTIIFNGGRRGLQIEIPPGDLVKLLNATAAEIAS